jgi:hypothetical protein
MKIVRQYAVLMVVFFCVRVLAADGDFYRLFQSAVTNSYLPLQRQSLRMDSPLLVDTNNTGYKLTNVLLHLERLRANGEPSGIRLGMKMEDVVARWGKPLWIDPQCGGYPHFAYSEAHVYFEPATNSVRAFHADLAELARTLPTWPTVEDCLRKVGKPSQRIYLPTGISHLVYEASEGRIRLSCNSDTLLVGVGWGPEK